MDNVKTAFVCRQLTQDSMTLAFTTANIAMQKNLTKNRRKINLPAISTKEKLNLNLSIGNAMKTIKRKTSQTEKE